ncbi:MAG: hypothetical protein ACE5HL_08225 [Terriglobia bacterium]
MLERKHRKLILGKLLVAAALLFAFTPSLAAQAELDSASLLLQQLHRDLIEAKKAHKAFSRQKIRSRLAQIETPINEGILSLLNQPTRASKEQLEEKLGRVVAWCGYPQPESITVLSWGEKDHPVYVVAYTMPFCYSVIDGRSFIGVFGPQIGGYVLLASVEDPLPDRYIRLLALNIPGVHRVAFLAYGTRWGDAHTRLTAIAYVFDGKQLKSIWSRRDVPRGELKLEQGTIVLYSVNDMVRPWQERTEVYRITPKGIELETASEKAIP